MNLTSHKNSFGQLSISEEALFSALNSQPFAIENYAPLYPKGLTIFSVSATLYDLTPHDQRQMDMLLDDDAERQRFEAITDAMDRLNTRFARTVVSLGPWNPPAGGHVGGKISYCRIPDAEDFL